MRINQVTQAYRKVILEQDFQDTPTKDLSNKTVAISHYQRKLTSLTQEAKLLEKEIENLDNRGLIKILNSVDEGEVGYKIFVDNPNQPDTITVMNTPMNKYPEIRERVIKITKKLNEIYKLQIEIREQLGKYNLLPYAINEGKWEFTELENSNNLLRKKFTF